MKLRKISSLVLVLLVLLSLSVTAFAADSTVTYSGKGKFGFTPGSEYTASDLFDNFKGVMPGDVRTETITVKNTARSCDFIRVYLRAQLHEDETSGKEDPNLMHDTVKAKAETLEKMNRYLGYMTLVVMDGDKEIFNGKANELDGLEKKVLLGKLRRNKSLTLDVELTVSPELESEFANFAGEVDWVFTVSEYDDKRPDTPKTGDETDILPYVLMLAVGMTGMVILLAGKRRRQK